MAAPSPRVISEIQELNPEWLSTVLQLEVTSVHHDAIVGEGYASRMYRLHLDGHDELPESLILKLASLDEAQRELMDPDVFCREVYFYSDVGQKLRNSDMLPRVYYAEANKPALQLTLLFEDMGPLPHKPWREGLDNSLAAVSALAQIHATYWDADELNAAELAPIESELDVDELEALVQENLNLEAAADYNFPYLCNCAVHVMKLAKWLVGESDKFHGAVSLVHGDFHNRNLHFAEGRTIVFDWQVTERGRPVRDVIYWMLMCVDVDDITEFKPQLIDQYLSELERHGVTYKKSHFVRDFNESLLQMVSRIFCYQSLITLSDEDAHELENFLSRADAMARVHYIRAQLRIARVIMPPIVMLLRLFGKR
jgi:hypothetical protein